jgi:predicted permease
VRRSLDLVLIVVILAAVGFGAYKLGGLVDNKSKEASSESANTTPATTTATVTTTASNHSKGPSRRTVELVIIAVAGAAGVMLVVQIGGSLFRTRKRQKWHA